MDDESQSEELICSGNSWKFLLNHWSFHWLMPLFTGQSFIAVTEFCSEQHLICILQSIMLKHYQNKKVALNLDDEC